MTRFKKCGDIVTHAMPTKDRTIITLPNGEIQIDPTAKTYTNRKWFESITKPDGSIDYHCFADKMSSIASEMVVRYVLDAMEGKNVAKGTHRRPRSEHTIYQYRTRLPQIIMRIEKMTNKKLPDFQEDDVFLFFKGMRNGTIRSLQGDVYLDVRSYVKIFASFWRWHMRVAKKKKLPVLDIVSELDMSKSEKPKWNYITLNDAKRMADIATSLYYKALVLFLFDSGIRPPKELMNVRVKDITPIPNSNHLFLEIRDSTSKTFGRKIKLFICSSVLKKYIKESGKNDEDFLFDYTYASMNAMIKKLGHRVLKKGREIRDSRNAVRVRGGISMYDFRHSSVCHYLPIYKSENQMKYRYGWKKADMIHYYSELIGMRDTLKEEDMLTDDSLYKVELELEKEKQKVELLREQMKSQQQDMQKKMEKLEAMMLQKFAQDF